MPGEIGRASPLLRRLPLSLNPPPALSLAPRPRPSIKDFARP